MSEDENICCAQLDSCTGLYISMALLRDVLNGRDLREKVISGALQCAILKPSLIIDPFQVIVAANKAAVSFAAQTMVTKSVYTELLFNLSISKNITQSLVKFGIQEDDRDILIATIHKKDLPGIQEVIAEVKGKVVPLLQLQDLCDDKLLCKTYKISEAEKKAGCLIDSVVSRIVTSDFVSH